MPTAYTTSKQANTMAEDDGASAAENIRVAVRCRPMSKKEIGEGATCCFRAEGQVRIPGSRDATVQRPFCSICCHPVRLRLSLTLPAYLPPATNQNRHQRSL